MKSNEAILSKIESEIIIGTEAEGSKFDSSFGEINGMSSFLFLEEESDEKFVIKYIPEISIFLGEEILDKLKSLKNERIAPFLDYKIDEDDVYIVKKYEEGKTLGEIVKGSAVLLESELLHIMIEATNIVEFVHDNTEFTSMNLMPENLLYSITGNIVILDVLDIVRLQMGISQKADKQIDIYNLGSIIFYLATKTYPSNKGKGASDISKLRVDLSDGFCSMLNKCLDTDVSKRYKDTKKLKKEQIALVKSRKIKKAKRGNSKFVLPLALITAFFLLLSIILTVSLASAITEVVSLRVENELMERLEDKKTIKYKSVEIISTDWVHIISDREDSLIQEVEEVLGRYRRINKVNMNFIENDFDWLNSTGDVLIFSHENSYDSYPDEIKNLITSEDYSKIKEGKYKKLEYIRIDGSIIKIIIVN